LSYALNHSETGKKILLSWSLNEKGQSMKKLNTIERSFKKSIPLLFLLAIVFMLLSCRASGQQSPKSSIVALREDFSNPPRHAGVRCWWWWLNSNVTKEAITRDLEEMKAKGFSGAMIFDAGGANQRSNAQVPDGPTFASPEWRQLYKHALNEGKRLGLELGLSIQSGWNLGGPNVTPDFAAKQITWSEIRIEGPAQYEQKLPLPKNRSNYYKDICVLAYPTGPETNRASIENLELKAGYKELGGSAPDCRFLLNDRPSTPREQDVLLGDIRDISEKMTSDGTLKWSAPAGNWTVLHFGYTITSAEVSTYSADWNGHVIDYLSRDAFDRYWNEIVEPLLKEAGPLAGTTLKQLETDSWECGGMNWSPGFAADFIKYRGYDPIPYLPVFAGKIVENRDISNAFLADFRKTLGDCVADNHYKVFAEYAHKHNIQIQPESGGPHAGPLDAIKNLGKSDIVMGEFWAPSPHRPKPVNRFFIKQSSSVAHIYGKKYVGAESFTTIGPHWNDVLWKSQKPSMDHEICSGLNMIFFHTFTCSPKEMGIPGQEYFAGTHVNPQVTWWEYSDAFIDYINRCQFLVQQGKFVADVLYYYGDHVPNLVQLKEADPAKVLPGYDYDVTDEDILLKLKVEAGRILVPGGVRYRLLVLPDHKVLSLAALEKVNQLLVRGASVLGPKPERLVSIVGGVESQRRFKELADQLWGDSSAAAGQKQIGKGRLIWGKTARQVLVEDGVNPDFEIESSKDTVFDYIHYRIDEMDVYFVCNQTERTEDVLCRFRVAGKKPELWDPVTGHIRRQIAFTISNKQTEIPLRFGSNGSVFVVFTNEVPKSPATKNIVNYTDYMPVMTIAGPWQVRFDPKWGAPGEVTFDKLISWTQHPEPGIKFYSGKATYRKTFTFEEKIDRRKQYCLDLGKVEDVGIARVTLNGRDLGILWTKSFRVDISDALKPGQNLLEVNVVNSWRNRLVGDRDLPQSRRYTKTNITIRPEWKLLESGLLGPVTIKKSQTGS
jgi:hypothetical protein